MLEKRRKKVKVKSVQVLVSAIISSLAEISFLSHLIAVTGGLRLKFIVSMFSYGENKMADNFEMAKQEIFYGKQNVVFVVADIAALLKTWRSAI